MSDDILDIEPGDALERQRAGALLLDVRELDERASGFAAGSVAMPRATIGERIAALASSGREILAICGSGKRSLLAAQTLRELGYARSFSVRGGFARWQSEEGPSNTALSAPTQPNATRAISCCRKSVRKGRPNSARRASR
jgi:rhodanese-related sulfurtransferase